MTRADADVRIAPVRSDGALATWVEVYNRAAPCRPEGPAQLRHYWELAPEWRSVIAWQGDRPVGVAHVEVQHWVHDSRNADAEIVVPKEHRRRGVGTALYRDASTWAADRGLTGLEVWLDGDEPDGPEFWVPRGYREVGRERVSQVDLRGVEPPREFRPPDGVELVTLEGREDLEEGMYRVGAEGIADIPGPDTYDAGDFDHWRRGELRKPGLMEDCSVVALAGGEVVGLATVVRLEGRPHVGDHELTAVARDWRGRGIARAMKALTISLAHDAGLSALESVNEDRNAAILAVNARLGYVHLTDFAQLQGPLAPQP
jgi:GNAT superfamily N-acetyltransferase